MASSLDKIHSHGMSPNASIYMTVRTFTGPDSKQVAIQPPLRVVFEGESPIVAFSQDGLTARYHDDELRQIGEGSSALGMKRVIGDIAMHGNLEYGATKPLHPGLLDGEVIPQPALPDAQPAIMA